MKQDIRDLFKNEEDVDSLNQLPDHHRAEFLDKLKKTEKQKQKSFVWLSIAAVLLIAFTIGFNMFNSEIEAEDNSPIIAQIEMIEAQYLANIETEWQSFIALANDEILVQRFRKKLDELDADYKAISIEFKSDSNNIMVIEALVDNLQTRLQILKDIQKHIKILNQKDEQYENTI